MELFSTVQLVVFGFPAHKFTVLVDSHRSHLCYFQPKHNPIFHLNGSSLPGKITQGGLAKTFNQAQLLQQPSGNLRG